MRDDPASTFSLLGNETRLRVVIELGDASPPGEFGVLGFTDLQSRVGVDDNGNFNYHLGQLTGEFVERADGGYRLTLPGVYVYRALKTGALTETAEPRRLETDVPCLRCEVTQEVWLEDGRGHLGCPDCESINYRYPLPAGGQTRTDGQELAVTLRERAIHDASAMLRGFCPYCSGPIDRYVEEDVEVLPESDKVEGADELTTTLACEHCGWFIRMNLAGMLDSHPMVSAFLLDQGVDSYRRDPWREATFTVDVRSEDPWYAHIDVTCRGTTLSVELAEDLEIREVDRETASAVAHDGRSATTEDDGEDRAGVTGRGTGV